jgi:hypothetical protein
VAVCDRRGCEPRDMKVLCLAVMALCLFAVAPLMATHYEVIVLTGQSNSLGTTGGGEEDSSPGSDSADDQVKFFWHNRVDAERALGDSGGDFSSLQAQQGGMYAGDATHWGPEMGFGRAWVQSGGPPLAIIKSSRGGGGNGLWSKEAEGHMYRQVVETVRAATEALVQNGDTFEIVGLLYLQGESDSPEEAAMAGQRLETLANNLRDDLPEAGKMVVVCGGIAADGEARDLVRKKQAEAAASNDTMVYFDNRDLKGHLYDQLHFDKAAKLMVGERFARAYGDLVSESHAD